MLLEGQQIGRYRFLHLLGSGGMGDVYLAEDDRIGQQVAIKVIKAELGPYPETGSLEEATRLFQREAKAIVKLDHPHILPLYDYGETRLGDVQLVYLVMPYRAEGSLATWMRDHYQHGLPTAQDVAHFIRQAAEALQHAHEHQIVHQDVKPSNFLLRQRAGAPTRPDVLLADFGIARFMSASSSASHTVRGTPTYMAPEQYRGEPVPATDQYALAVMAYELLTGRPMFQGNPVQMMYQHLSVAPPAASTFHPQLPKELDEALLIALAKDPKDRFGSVTAFASAFQNALPRETTPLPVVLPQAPRITDKLPAVSAGLGQMPNRISEKDIPTALAGNQSAPPATPPPEASGMSDALTVISNPNVPAAPPEPPALAVSGISDALTVISSPAIQAALAATPQDQQETATNLPPTIPPPAALPVAPGSLPALPPTVPPPPLAMILGHDLPTDPNPPTPEMLAALVGGQGGSGVVGGRRPNKLRRVALATIAAVVVLGLAFGGVAFAFPGLLHGTSKAAPVTASKAPVIPATSATVTITPASKNLSQTFNIQAVTGTPDASQGQVQARNLSQTTPSRHTTVNATGQGQIPGTHATGILGICNLDTANGYILYGGVGIPNGNASPNIHMVLYAQQFIPANNAGGATCSGNTIYPSAYVQEVGTIGNVTTGQWATCFYNCLLRYASSNFSGGTNPQPYTYVKQSDIDNAARSLETRPPNAQQVLQDQLGDNEQFIGAPQCLPRVSSDHKANDRVGQVTVTVSYVCTGEVYDYDGAVDSARGLLSAQAAKDPGAGYGLVGQINATPGTATPGAGGTVTLPVQVAGLWAYQFSDQTKQQLAGELAGVTAQDAVHLLWHQAGVVNVLIQLSGGNAQILPQDARHIKIVVQEVSGP